MLFLLCLTCLPSATAQATATKSAADYYVSSLPGAPSPLLKMYAGHMEITPEHHGNMFFWLYQNRHIGDRQRTVIWLNGGPGCSSMDGALMEVGPYRVNEDQTLRLNNGSWDEFANVLFVDNPVGTGFSYVDGDSYVKDLPEMADQMVVFLEKWFRTFPEYKSDDLYIAGESYAGQHIPYIANAILDRNEKKSPEEKWNLSGLLIGNGWISGVEQYRSYIPFARENGLLKQGSAADTKAEQQERVCIKALDEGAKDRVDSGQCEAIMMGILQDTNDNGNCYNMYDVRLKDSYPSCGMNWPPDLPAVTQYLRTPEVISALHINPDKKTGWKECNNQVSGAFRPRAEPSVRLLPRLLENMPMILFSGDKDLICNHIGTESLIARLEFNGGTGMETQPGHIAPRRDWTFEDEPAGTWQTARNLTYIRFYNSSHMVPFDYPRRTRDMLDRFIGVDIGSIGGRPAGSRIDGEKGLETSVGGHPNSTAAEQEAGEKLDAARWTAYKRSGEAALVVVILIVGVWAFFIWRDRRRRRGYFGVGTNDGDDGPGGGLGLDRSSFGMGRGKRGGGRDVEAADFDEAELDELTEGGRSKGERFGLADEEDSEEDERFVGRRGANGHAS